MFDKLFNKGKERGDKTVLEIVDENSMENINKIDSDDTVYENREDSNSDNDTIYENKENDNLKSGDTIVENKTIFEIDEMKVYDVNGFFHEIETKITSEEKMTKREQPIKSNFNNKNDSDKTVLLFEDDNENDGFRGGIFGWLILLDKNLIPTKSYELKSREISIGRKEFNDITIIDSSISGEHALLKFDGEKLNLIDNNSTNGTLVNDLPITKTILNDKDSITFGESKLLIKFL